MRKYLNYILFGAVVLLVVGLAVSHSRHTRSLLNDMTGSDPQAHARAATELIKAEQFSDAITGELPATRVKVARALQDLPTGDCGEASPASAQRPGQDRAGAGACHAESHRRAFAGND